MKFTLFAAVLSTIIKKSKALQCGTSLTNDCIADTDIRYDPDYTNDILKQASVWEKDNGFKKVIGTTQDGDGNPLYAIPYDEITGTYGTGPLTNFVDQAVYSNRTIIGSRFYEHIYVFTRPVPKELCQGGPPEGVVDGVSMPSEETVVDADVDQPICGVNGRFFIGDVWGTSTYEKDGSIHEFRGLGWRNSNDWTIKTPIDDHSLYIVSRDRDANIQWSGDDIYYGDNYEKVASSASLYLFGSENPLQSHSKTVAENVDEEQWLKEIQGAMDEYNLHESQRALISLPMTTECLHPEECVTDEEFCTAGKDPNCSVSPYQEPEASLNGGGIALIVILCAAAVAAVAYVVHRHVSAAMKKRYKEHFIRGIASNITITQNAGTLSPELLQKEFDHIDKDKGGTISKSELKEFFASGKVGELSEKDFNAMWASLDIDDSGEVDFVEFAVFLSSCGAEFDKVHKEQSAMTKEEKLKYASQRLSAINLAAAQVPDIEE